MSRVSFINTDVTGIRFSDKTKWGGNDMFQVIEELWLKEDLTKSMADKRSSIGGVLSIYRNLRENYEYRRRYDDAGKFFIREMEIKRHYREAKVKNHQSIYETKENCWFRRNIFSLIGWYHILSNYGEGLLKPTIWGIVFVFSFSFIWLSQSNPNLQPSFFPEDTITNQENDSSNHLLTVSPNSDQTSPSSSSFIGLAQVGNGTQWLKSFERSAVDFLPLLSSGGSDFKLGLIDYVFKIVGGAVIFGLIVIALRRRFERKYTH
jgi:hypothetical protein